MSQQIRSTASLVRLARACGSCRAALVAMVTAACAAGAAHAQVNAPMSDPSLDDLRDAFFAPAYASRSFRRTDPPTTDGLCAGAGASASVAAAGGTRTLVVVPYGGTDARHADLAIQFATGSDDITPASKKVLDRVATVLKEPGVMEVRFAVAGHTDATGTDKLNLELSCARAIAVREYLVKTAGIRPERLSAYGFGSSKPLERGDLKSAKNRRVEVRLAE